jgi:L-ribulokinase
MSKYTIGIDFGTLSGRAVLVDVKDGREVADCVLNYPHAVMDEVLAATGEKLPANYALQDPQDYLQVLDTVIPAVLQQSGVNPADVIGVGVDFTCCTCFPVFADGTPLCFTEEYKANRHAYVKLWKHHAAQPYADRFNEVAAARGEAFLDDFGGKVSSEWMFAKLLELLEEAPEIYHACDYVVEAADWINWQLTGELTRGYLFAAYKTEYRMDSGYPSPDFLAALNPDLRDVADTKLAGRMTYIGERAGTLSAKAAARWGLCEGIAVATAMPDAHVASPALAQSKNGDMFGILGTSGCYMLIDRDYRSVPGICGVVRDGLVPGFYGYEAGLCCFGDHFAWAAENLMTLDYVKEAQERGLSPLKLLIEKASRQAPGAHGLIALNWFNGNRNILVNANLSGAFIGMTLRTKPEDMLRALIEATAYGTRVIIENYREYGVNVNTFVAGGGIARKDPFTMQMFADILKMDIRIAGSTQIPALASGIYAAAVAGKAAGGYDTLEEASAAMNSVSDLVYRPNPEASAVYDKLFAEYKLLHDYFGRGGNDVMMRLRDIASAAN